MEKLAKFEELTTGLSYKDIGGYVLSDGATSNRAIIQTPGTRGNLAGAPVASWVGWVDVPNTPFGSFPNFNEIASIKSNGSAVANNLAASLYIMGGVNALIIGQRGSSQSFAREFTHASFHTIYSGQRIWLEVRITQGTNNPVVRVNGIDISSSFSAGTGGATPPQWLDTTLNSSSYYSGWLWPTGNAPQGCWLNAHLTDAESETWRTTGRAPAWVAAGGNMVSYYNGLNAASKTTETNATTNLNAAGTNNGSWASIAGARTGGSGSFYARWTSDNSGAGANNMSLSVNGTINNRIGQRVGVRFWARSSQNLSVLTSIVENNSGATDNLPVNITANWTEFVLLFPTPLARVNINSFRFINFTYASGETIDIDDLEWIQLGALSLPTTQPINVLDDATLIGGNQGRLLGMTPVTTQMLESQIVVPSTAFTTTSIQILGGAITGGTKRRVVSVSGNSSASVNISLGTSSGGTQIVNTQAVNGDFDITTFASRIIAANSSLWVTFSGSTTASITIRLGDIV